MVLIDDNGLQKLSYEENLEIAENYIKTEQGEDVDLSPSGPWGQIAVILAKLMSDNGDQQEETYLSRDPDNATGVSLDKLSAETGTVRKGATFTQVFDVLLEGDEGTYIPRNKQVQMNPATNPDPELYFTINEDTYITKNTVRKVWLDMDEPSTGTVYTININSTVITHTATAGQTKEDVANALLLQFTEDISGSYDSVEEILSIYGIDDVFVLAYLPTVQLNTLWGSATFTANLTGAYYVPEGSLTEIATPVTGWTSVTNPSAGIAGAPRETDAAFRIRRLNELIKGLATDNAIRAAVFNVENVTAVTVISNRLPYTDVDGRPEKSFETIVTGGEDDDIAQAIYDTMPGGIEPYGVDSDGTATDPVDGEQTVIPFTRPQATYIWVRYTRTPNTEEVFPNDGVAQVKQNVVAWAEANIEIGTDVISQKLLTPLYEVPGTKSAVVELAETALPTDTPSYSEVVSISVDGRTEAQFDVSRVFVQEA